MTNADLLEARWLVRQTLLDMGKKSIPIEWKSCPACGTKDWKHLSAFSGLEEVCYPCGLLAMIVVAGPGTEAEADYMERLHYAYRWYDEERPKFSRLAAWYTTG